MYSPIGFVNLFDGFVEKKEPAAKKQKVAYLKFGDDRFSETG